MAAEPTGILHIMLHDITGEDITRLDHQEVSLAISAAIASSLGGASVSAINVVTIGQSPALADKDDITAYRYVTMFHDAGHGPMWSIFDRDIGEIIATVHDPVYACFIVMALNQSKASALMAQAIRIVESARDEEPMTP